MATTDVMNPTYRREVAKALIVTALGFLAVLVLAHIYDFGSRDAASIVGLTVLAAVVVSIAGVGAMYLCRNRSIGSQAGLLFLIAGFGVALAALWSANEMFLSRHDLGVLMVVLASAGTLASLGAIAFGRRINNAVARIIFVTRHIKADSDVSLPPSGAPKELTQLARALESMSHRLRFEQEKAEMLERSRRELVAFVSKDIHEHLEHIRLVIPTLSSENQGDISNELTAIGSAVQDMTELLIDSAEDRSSVA